MSPNKAYAERVRETVHNKKAEMIAQKSQEKQARAEARRQQMQEDKINKAKIAQT